MALTLYVSKRGAGALLLLLTMVGEAYARQSIAASPPLIFDKVTVVDVEQGRLLADQRVVVIGNRISAVGSEDLAPKMPKGARIIDARGKYLIPGLWDMHVHTEEGGDIAHQDSLYRAVYPRYVANGITGIREIAERWSTGADSFRVWQRDVLAGRRIGPRAVGPSADLSFLASRLTTPLTPEYARRIIDSLKAAHDAFVKFHGGIEDRAIFFAFLGEARRVGLPFVGHLPVSVTNVEAADSGVRSIEHSSEERQCWVWGEPMPDSVALDSACAPVAQAYLRNGTWIDPTLVSDWLGPISPGEVGEHDPELWANTLRLWRTLHRMGVRNFLAGSDWFPLYQDHYGPDFRPGLAAREELVFLADAGLSPLEALRAGTLNPAMFLGASDSLGSVVPGKLADLVLLDGDPLADITNVLKLWGVVANGRYFDRASLDAMDPEGADHSRGFVAASRRARNP